MSEKELVNRALSHLNDDSESHKVKKIKEIRAAGKEPRIDILRHGLDNKTAFHVEAAVIDSIGISNLANGPRGQDTDQGRMPLWLLPAILDPKDVEIEEHAILIRINRRYRYGMSDEELYESTRGIWVIGTKRECAKYAFAIFKGIIIDVYKIDKWYLSGTKATFYKIRPELNEHYIYDPQR
jgi:hypothetical protein